MENIEIDTNYNSSFLTDIQNQISVKIADLANQQNNSRKNDLKYCFDNNAILRLSEYNKILEQIKSCNKCLNCEDINKVVSKVKKLINNL